MPTPQRSTAESLSFRNLPAIVGCLAACRTGACGFAVYTVVILIWDNLTYNLLGIRLVTSSRRLHSTLVISIPYNPSNSFARAMLVGLFNSCE